MAYVVTAKILMDANDDVQADKIVRFLLERSLGGAFIDFSTEGVAKTNLVIDDSIANETYEAGDFSRSWVIFSPSKNEINENGYWSKEYGWTDKDLATIFDYEDVSLPADVNDAILMMRDCIPA